MWNDQLVAETWNYRHLEQCDSDELPKFRSPPKQFSAESVVANLPRASHLSAAGIGLRLFEWV